ncbi:MAG: hypothetical protein ACFCVK_03540 [Acidimicrobiales bacterium]
MWLYVIIAAVVVVAVIALFVALRLRQRSGTVTTSRPTRGRQ